MERGRRAELDFWDKPPISNHIPEAVLGSIRVKKNMKSVLIALQDHAMQSTDFIPTMQIKHGIPVVEK